MTLRERYQPIIAKLSARIDNASREHVETGSIKKLWEYYMLIEEMKEIKNSIILSEEKETQ